MILTQNTQNIEYIQTALKHSLPGWEGQSRMAPENRANQNRQHLVQAQYRQGGVLILLYPARDQILSFALIRRPQYKGVHSGQISLPGGKHEPGETLEQTALRETFEEIGVPAQAMRVLGHLSSLYIPPSNFMVYPYVAFSPTRPIFQPDSVEVAEIIETPLTLIFEQKGPHYQLMDHPRLGPISIPYYDVYGHVVWGATAMILSEFMTMLGG